VASEGMVKNRRTRPSNTPPPVPLLPTSSSSVS